MALRDYAVDYEDYRKPQKQNKFKIIKNNKKSKVHKANKASLVLSLFSVFSMLVIISYRYNIISEKNLEVQRLQISEEEVNAILTNSEVDYSKMVDITSIEAYATQQLGMQEPEKSQIVYLSGNYDTQYVANSNNVFANFVNNVKQKINEIF